MGRLWASRSRKGHRLATAPCSRQWMVVRVGARTGVQLYAGVLPRNHSKILIGGKNGPDTRKGGDDVDVVEERKNSLAVPQQSGERVQELGAAQGHAERA